MEKKKSRGSFGIPKDMMDEIQKSKEKQGGPQEASDERPGTYTDAESIPEGADEETQKESPKKKSQDSTEDDSKLSEATTEEEKTEMAEKFREDLGIEFTEDDLWNFWIGRSLIKREVVIVPDKIVATFRTINASENRDISRKMSEALDDKLLEDGFRSLRTERILSHCLLEIGKPGEEKSLGETAEERFEAVENMNIMMIDKLRAKWNCFVWLLDYTVSKEMELKKS